MIRKTAALFALLVLAVAMLRAAAGFENDDRVVFFGDSITHGGTYHLYLRDYYYTRYPGKSFEFLNRGLSGDSAAGALKRLGTDVISARPTRVLVHFGMNDIGRNNYGLKPITPGLEKTRRAAIIAYDANLEALIRQLTAKNIKVTILSPTPYDETMVQDGENLVGCANALAQCATIGRRLGASYHCDTIDLLTPMLELNREVQRRNPADTIISTDRVHPREVGHPIIAGLILEAQQVPGEVAAATIDAGSGKVTATRNCIVKDLTAKPGEIEFSYLPAALPFPLFPEQARVDQLWGFSAKLNREPLTVTGLEPGKYKLLMNGAPVGEFTAAEFAAGVNLAVLAASPLQHQSQQIRKGVRAVGALEAKLCVLGQVKAMFDARKVKANDPEAVNACWEQLFKQYANNDKYWRGLRKTYEETLPRRIEIAKERESLLAEIEKARKVEPVKVSIRKQ